MINIANLYKKVEAAHTKWLTLGYTGTTIEIEEAKAKYLALKEKLLAIGNSPKPKDKISPKLRKLLEDFRIAVIDEVLEGERSTNINEVSAYRLKVEKRLVNWLANLEVVTESIARAYQTQ